MPEAGLFSVILLEVVHEGGHALAKGCDDQDRLGDNVQIEGIVVANADTIIDPGAMMVEALNAVATNRAVPTATRSDRAAIWAQLRAVYVLEHVKEVDLWVL